MMIILGFQCINLIADLLGRPHSFVSKKWLSKFPTMSGQSNNASDANAWEMAKQLKKGPMSVMNEENRFERSITYRRSILSPMVQSRQLGVQERIPN
jgi:hypothetical protein